jgi:nitroreductase
LRQGNLLPARRFDSISLPFCSSSLGPSAWKSYGAKRWALRRNPSSGNLHPTEGYLYAHVFPACPPGPSPSAGTMYSINAPQSMIRTGRSVFRQRVLVGISSIHWREAWKYGMRSWRYCQHDCGHAIAAVSYAAAALGWQTRLVLSTATTS